MNTPITNSSSLKAQVERIINGSYNSLNGIDDSHPQIEDDEQKKVKTLTRNQIRESFRHDSSNTRKYAEYSTEHLVALSRESAEECKLIAKELNRRCGGTSIGYLSLTQLLILCEYYSSFRNQTTDELLRQHSQLQLDIQQLTDHDPFEILSVPVDKLLHLVAITLCLQNTAKNS